MTICQSAELIFVHLGASWPPIAPSTTINCGFLLGSASAITLKLLVPLVAHSWVTFDMPLESKTIFPAFVSTLPEALSGLIRLVAMFKPAARCAGGRLFALLG